MIVQTKENKNCTDKSKQKLYRQIKKNCIGKTKIVQTSQNKNCTDKSKKLYTQIKTKIVQTKQNKNCTDKSKLKSLYANKLKQKITYQANLILNEKLSKKKTF